MGKVAKTTFYLMIVTAIAKVLGMGRELVLSSIYGTGIYTESYLTAMNIPNVIFAAVGTAIVTTFIPMYQEVYNKEGSKRAIKFLNNILNIILVICFFIAIFGNIFSKELVKIFAMGFEGERLALTIKFTKILIVGIIFISASSIMAAYLQINDKFMIVGIGSIPYNLVIIFSIIMSSFIGPYTLPIGAVIAMLIQLLYYIYFVKKTTYKYELYINFKDEYLKRLLILLSPVLLGVVVNQLNAIIDTTLASTLVNGSIPALTYANRLNGFVMGIFTVSVVSVIYPMLSKLSSEKNNERFVTTVISSVNIIIVLLIPISVGSMILSKPVIRVLFERGAFDVQATKMTAQALLFYSIGMTAFGLRDILSKIFYSLKDTKTPMINGIISVFINIALNLLLIKKLGHMGLALATSISSIVCIVLLFISLRKKIKYFGQDKILKTLIKSIISAVFMGVDVYFIYNFIYKIVGTGSEEELFAIVISVGSGALVYGILINFLKVEEISTILNIVKRKIQQLKK